MNTMLPDGKIEIKHNEYFLFKNGGFGGSFDSEGFRERIVFVIEDGEMKGAPVKAIREAMEMT